MIYITKTCCQMLACRFIILEADAEVTPWSRICVSQADCILLVGAHNSGPKVQYPCCNFCCGHSTEQRCIVAGGRLEHSAGLLGRVEHSNGVETQSCTAELSSMCLSLTLNPLPSQPELSPSYPPVCNYHRPRRALRGRRGIAI